MSRYVPRQIKLGAAPRGSRVRNRCRTCYSLWPEQARPRRAIPLTTAVGGLAMVIVCAVAFYCIVTDFFNS